MTEFINLTPHGVIIRRKDGSELRIMPDGNSARVAQTSKVVGVIDGIEIFQNTFGEVENLPEPKAGTAYIVSRMVKDRCPERTDVLVPGNPIRDESGSIIGSNGLVF